MEFDASHEARRSGTIGLVLGLVNRGVEYDSHGSFPEYTMEGGKH